MAKNSPTSKNPSRIRFVLVEAELGDGDLHQITQAITNALRPTVSAAPKRIASTGPLTSNVEIAEEVVVEHEPGVEDTDEQPPAVSKSPRVRSVPKAPDIVDIDMKTAISLASFSAGKDTGSQHKKYLVAAAWLKECREITGVNANHIYTCFRSMQWSVNISDFSQPLRQLKAKKYFTKDADGNYSINHIGLDYVEKLGGNGAS